MADSEDLMIMAQRILGASEAQAVCSCRGVAAGLGRSSAGTVTGFPAASWNVNLSGSVGAATAHAMVGQIVGGASVSVQDLMAVADETAQMLEYSSQLEAKSQELSRTARQLRDANEKLTQLSRAKRCLPVARSATNCARR